MPADRSAFDASRSDSRLGSERKSTRLETRESHVRRRAAQIRSREAQLGTLLDEIGGGEQRFAAPRVALLALRRKVEACGFRLRQLDDAALEEWESMKAQGDHEWRDLATEFQIAARWVKALSRRSRA